MSEIVLIKDIIDSFLQHGEKDYPFESEEVIRFAEFCKESGGFEIC